MTRTGRLLAVGAVLVTVYTQWAWFRRGELLAYRQYWLILFISLGSIACGLALWPRQSTRGAALVLFLVACAPQSQLALGYVSLGEWDPYTPFLWFARWGLPGALLMLYPNGSAVRPRIFATLFGLVPVILAVLAARGFVVDRDIGSWLNVPSPWIRAAELWLFLTTLAACLVAIRRHRRAGRVGRRALRPFVLAGVAWSLDQWVLIAWAQLAPTRTGSEETPGFELIAYDLPEATLLALIGAIGWVELVRPRLGRTKDGVLRLPDDAATGIDQACSEVRRALRDSTAQLLFVNDNGHVVTAEGKPAPPPTSGQVTTWLERGGERIGAIQHSAVLLAEPNVLKLGAVIGAAAVDNHRLHALTLARLEETRAAAARMIDAAGEASDTLVQAVLTGPVRRLDEALAKMDDAGDDTIAEVHALLLASLDEVRNLSHASPVATGGLTRSLPELIAARGADVDLRVVDTDRYEPALETTVLLVAAAACAIADVRGERTLVDVQPIAGGLTVSVEPVTIEPPPDLVDRATALGGHVTVGPGRWQVDLPSTLAAVVAG